MKRLLASTAIVLMASTPLYAQDAAKPAAGADTSAGSNMSADNNMAASSSQGSDTFLQSADQGDKYASDLMGARLYVTENDLGSMDTVTTDQRADWNDVGEVNDILVSKSGDVRAVLLDIGGFLGMGEKTIAVDMSQLHFLSDPDNAGDWFIAMNGTEDSLKNAPEFQRDDNMAAGTDANMAAGNGTNMAAGTAAPAAGTTDTNNMAATEQQPAADTMGGPMMERPTAMPQGYTALPPADLTADRLDGATVYGPDDQTVGEIGNLILTDDGKISDAVVDVGGFLGIGEKPVKISFDEMQIVQDESGAVRVNVNATEDVLKQRPEYQGN